MKFMLKLRYLSLAMVAGTLSLSAVSPSLAEDALKWVPGEVYPTELLKNYPCLDYTQACGKMMSPPIEHIEFKGPLQGDADRGEKIATNLRWGNCIACHILPKQDGGTIGPTLRGYGAREMPLDYTYQRIWDVRYYNPNAHMPVYGPNKVLSDQDVQDVMAYLYSSK
jgi:sulfur-oxidizing protein SoxX